MMPGFFIFFFGVGACVTAIVCLIGNPGINLQIIIFLVVSVSSLLAFRKVLKRALFFADDEKSKSIEDEFTGKEAVAITDFDSSNRGKVEFKGTSWNAETNVPIKTGQIVKIIDKEGFTLKVELKNN
jgi:membrane protein implicated in regulation of membrane protease activity